MHRSRSLCEAGFTLIELLIVVVVIGILAAMVVPKFASARQEGSAAAIIGQFQACATGYEQVYTNTGSWPPDNDPAFLAAPYMKSNPWELPSPIGGKYNWNFFGDERPEVCIYGIGSPDQSQLDTMTAVDTALDDGNLNTGRVRWSPGSWGGTLRFWINDAP